jgi:hypothetical protein
MMRKPLSCGLAAVLIAIIPAPSFAGEASDAVRVFYEHPGLELDPAVRDRFVDPARKVLDQNDAIKAGGEPDGCLDPALAFDDSDYDPAVVAATLKLSEAVNGDDAKVVAVFDVPDGVAHLEWRLKKVGDAWKVADIVSMTKDWALSQFNCE